MGDKGNVIVLTSTKWKVIDEESGKIIARLYRNPNKLYVLKELDSHRYEED